MSLSVRAFFISGDFEAMGHQKGLAMTTFTDRKSLNRFDCWATRVSELMTRDPLSIRADATIREAIAILATKDITAAPVINEAGRPVGVFSLTDFLLSGVHDYTLDRGAFLKAQVSDLMTPFILSVDPDTRIYDVVRELLNHNVHQMYVAETDGTLIGVVSAAKLLEEIRRRADEQSVSNDCATAA
jgi:predicted transcriptional regulator